MDLQSPEKKMSKSLPPAGCVLLLDDPKVTAKKIRSAVTDTGREIVADPVAKPGITNLLTIHSALSGTPVAALEEQFAGRGYGDLKKELAEVVVDFVTPVRERTQELLGRPGRAGAGARRRRRPGPRGGRADGGHGLRPGRLPAHRRVPAHDAAEPMNDDTFVPRSRRGAGGDGGRRHRRRRSPSRGRSC